MPPRPPIWRWVNLPAQTRTSPVLEYDADTQAFSAVCPELPGCASAGDTEEEAKQNIKEAIELYLAPSDVELSRNAKLDEVTVG